MVLDYGLEQTVKLSEGSEKKIIFRGQMDRPNIRPSYLGAATGAPKTKSRAVQVLKSPCKTNPENTFK